MISNKDRLVLKRLTTALEAEAKADKTQEAKKARAAQRALEKAAGGKKNLDEAGGILDVAKKEAGRIVTAARSEADRISRIGADEIRKAGEVLLEKEQEFSKQKTALDKQKKATARKAMELENASLAVQGREKVADDRETTLDRREADIAAREMKVAADEDEIARFKAWRAAAPA